MITKAYKKRKETVFVPIGCRNILLARVVLPEVNTRYFTFMIALALISEMC